MNEKPSGKSAGRSPGMETIEIKPVILGGDPEDPDNKTLVSREQHFELVRYWNRVIREFKGKQ
jgi:hypothetical protein